MLPLRDNPLAGLLWTLIRTDFKARYHGSVAGFFWALLKPMATFSVLVAVFSFLFQKERNYTLNLIIGLCLWDFFSEATRVGITSLHAKAFLLNKARFPRWSVVVASASNSIITLGVTCGAILVYTTITRGAPSLVALLLFGLYLLQYLLIVVGFSLGASVLFLRYRDLNQIWDVVLQAGFFAVPIVYPLDILPERFHRYLFLFPVTPIVQFSRAVLVDRAIPSLRGHALLAAATALVVIVGVVVFRRNLHDAVEQT
jgi:lipopolysaccharide transport system permease protein